MEQNHTWQIIGKCMLVSLGAVWVLKSSSKCGSARPALGGSWRLWCKQGALTAESAAQAACQQVVELYNLA